MSDSSPQVAGIATSFWSGQFAPQRTVAQIAFDVAFGIILPAICLYYDPFVIRTSLGGPLRSGYGVAAGGIIAIGALSLVVWLAVGRPKAFLCGSLAAGAVFSSILGLLLFPLSVIGLLVTPISILGFTPLLTAFVFARNSVGAYRHLGRDKSALIVPATVGLAFAFAGPLAAQYVVTQQTSLAIELVQSPEPDTATVGRNLFKRMRYFVDPDELVNAFAWTDDEARRQRLADAYRELTGEDLQARADELWND